MSGTVEGDLVGSFNGLQLCVATSGAQLSQAELRREIQLLRRRPDLSMEERSDAMQLMLAGRWRRCLGAQCCSGRDHVVYSASGDLGGGAVALPCTPSAPSSSSRASALSPSAPSSSSRPSGINRSGDFQNNVGESAKSSKSSGSTMFTTPGSSMKSIPRATGRPNMALSCKHYMKNCSRFYFECCDTIDPCHRCHMDRGCETAPPQVRHRDLFFLKNPFFINTFLLVFPVQVASVRCNTCDYDQPPGRVCVNPDCLEPFSANHCEECMVWTQSDIHHCVGCGLCRVGTPPLGRVSPLLYPGTPTALSRGTAWRLCVVVVSP